MMFHLALFRSDWPVDGQLPKEVAKYVRPCECIVVSNRPSKHRAKSYSIDAQQSAQYTERKRRFYEAFPDPQSLPKTFSFRLGRGKKRSRATTLCISKTNVAGVGELEIRNQNSGWLKSIW